MADNDEYMLTTVDNPFNPFEEYSQWYAWDFMAGYHTPGALARIVRTSEEESEVDERADITDAIDEIVSENVTGMFRKVSRRDFSSVT